MTIENSAAQSMLCVGGSEEEVVPPAPPALSSSRRAISSGCRLRSSPRCHPGRRFNQAGVLMEAGASDPNPAILYLFYQVFYKRNAGPVTTATVLCLLCPGTYLYYSKVKWDPHVAYYVLYILYIASSYL